MKRAPEGAPPSLDQVLVLALRPFLARCAEALMQRDLSAWTHGNCPFCGWEPDFAVIMPSADRRLICGRCVGQWAFGSLTCPFCANADRALITSFATRDARYRVYACDVCRRYLKAYDARNAARPVMVSVDTIATLPLDAAESNQRAGRDASAPRRELAKRRCIACFHSCLFVSIRGCIELLRLSV